MPELTLSISNEDKIVISIDDTLHVILALYAGYDVQIGDMVIAMEQSTRRVGYRNMQNNDIITGDLTLHVLTDMLDAHNWLLC